MNPHSLSIYIYVCLAKNVPLITDEVNPPPFNSIQLLFKIQIPGDLVSIQFEHLCCQKFGRKPSSRWNLLATYSWF